MALISSIPKAKNEKQEAKQGGPIIGKDVPTKKWWVENNQAEKQNSPTTTGKNGSTFPNSLYPRPEHDLSKVVGGTQDTDTKTDVQPQDDLLEQLAGMLKDGSSSSTVPDLMAAFKTNNEQAMKQSQNLSNQLGGYGKQFFDLGKDLYYDQKNYYPLEADWAKQLLSYYGIESGEAADGARAAGAADNGGNIDSYAAANAERQRLSKLNAGVNSISGMSQNRFNNMLSTLESIGVNTANLFGVEQKNVQAALENAGTTGNLAVSAGETQTAADLQGNQDLLSLYASLYGGGTTEGEVADGKAGIVGAEGTIVRLLPTFYEMYPEASDDEIVSILVNEMIREGYTENKDWAKALVTSAVNGYKKQKDVTGPVP